MTVSVAGGVQICTNPNSKSKSKSKETSTSADDKNRKHKSVNDLQNAITLSFGGVDFRLIPSSSSSSLSKNFNLSSVSMIPNADGDFTAMSLLNFSGTLLVSPSATDIEKVSTNTPASPKSAKVVDEDSIVSSSSSVSIVAPSPHIAIPRVPPINASFPFVKSNAETLLPSSTTACNAYQTHDISQQRLPFQPFGTTHLNLNNVKTPIKKKRGRPHGSKSKKKKNSPEESNHPSSSHKKNRMSEGFSQSQTQTLSNKRHHTINNLHPPIGAIPITASNITTTTTYPITKSTSASSSPIPTLGQGSQFMTNIYSASQNSTGSNLIPTGGDSPEHTTLKIKSAIPDSHHDNEPSSSPALTNSNLIHSGKKNHTHIAPSLVATMRPSPSVKEIMQRSESGAEEEDYDDEISICSSTKHHNPNSSTIEEIDTDASNHSFTQTKSNGTTTNNLSDGSHLNKSHNHDSFHHNSKNKQNNHSVTANQNYNGKPSSSLSFMFSQPPPSSSSISNPAGNIPMGRWGHTLTLVDHSRIVLYGGQTYDTSTNTLRTLSDLYLYDMNKRKWNKPINCESLSRNWHTTTFLPDRQLLIAFGGESHDAKSGKNVTTDQVMVLDTEIMLWYPPSVSGTIPAGRSGHTSSLLPSSNNLVIFGGVGKNGKWQKNVAVLDTARWKWSLPKIMGSSPRARSYHTATPVPRAGKGGSGLLVIFGGNDDEKSFNSVHVLDTMPNPENGEGHEDPNGEKSSPSSSSSSSSSTEKVWRWSHPTVSGTPPSPRTGHCATLLEDGKTILIYGGWDPCEDDGAGNIDGTTTCDNKNASVAQSDEEMIYGDSFLLDTEAWTWSPGPKPKFFSLGANGPSNGGRRRTGHAAVLAPSTDGTQVLSFGGRVPNDKFTNDFQSIVIPKRVVSLRHQESI